MCAGHSIEAKSVHGKKVHLHGTLIDNLCWNDRTEDAATLLRQHSKPWLQMPNCVRSGYAIVTPGGKAYKLNPASDEATTSGSPRHPTTPTGTST